jgi:hypothetical protein
VEKDSAVKFWKSSNKVELVSLLHLLWELSICIVVCNHPGCVGVLRAGISQAEVGGPHVAYHWMVAVIPSSDKNCISATEHCSPSILNNSWVGNEVIWESSLLITSH